MRATILDKIDALEKKIDDEMKDSNLPISLPLHIEKTDENALIMAVVMTSLEKDGFTASYKDGILLLDIAEVDWDE